MRKSIAIDFCRLNNYMSTDFVQPKVIMSPISGEPVRPQLKTYIKGDQKITEAQWIDPASGTFIRKGIVSIEAITKPEQK